MIHPGPHFCPDLVCLIGHTDRAAAEAERCTDPAHADAYSDHDPAQLAMHIAAHVDVAAGTVIGFACEQLGRGIATVVDTTFEMGEVKITAEVEGDLRLVELYVDDLRDVEMTRTLLTRA